MKISDPYVGEEEIAAVSAVLRSGVLARGGEIKKFEENFARYTGVKHAIATSSGTTALHVALMANGITGEVIVPSFSFAATANAVLHAGATPVFVDVSEADFNIDADLIEGKITENTEAIIAVHLYGQPCDMGKLAALCKKHNLKLIEDACQAHGAEYNGRKVGSFGTGCFSFYATKNMITGEGGMITTNNDAVAETSRKIINHGSSENYVNTQLGYNFRMTEIQAAIGNVQISRLDELTKKRIENAKLYDKLLNVGTPEVHPGRRHVFHQYTIRVKNREEIIERLKKENIGYGIYYPTPIHKQKLYEDLGYNVSLPVSEKLSKEVLSIPVHPKLSKSDIENIASCVNGD